MRIKVLQEELSSALSVGLRAISPRSILPILSGVRLVAEEGRLGISATDLEITLHCSIEVSVEEEGKAIIPAKLLGEAVKGLPPSTIELSMNQDAGEARISCEKTQYMIKGLPLEDYPQLPVSDTRKGIKLSGDVVSEAIRQVVKAASRDETRPTLRGVLFSMNGGSMKIVATDSYRLAVKEVETDGKHEDFEVIIPARAVEELGRLAGEDEIIMEIGENQAFFKAGDVELISRLIEGQFPKYQQLLPEERTTRVSFNREKMIAAIKRVSILSPSSAIVKMTINESAIRMNSFTLDLGSAEDEIDCRVEGEGIETAFNAQYLLDGLAVIHGGEAYMDLMSPLKPAVLKSTEREDYLYLAMPIRLG